MIRIPLAIVLLGALLASPAVAAPCPANTAQADMARRVQGLQGCLQAPTVEAPAPTDPLAGPRTPTVAGCQSNASAEAAGCVTPTKAAAVKPRAARRVVKRTAKRP